MLKVDSNGYFANDDDKSEIKLNWNCPSTELNLHGLLKKNTKKEWKIEYGLNQNFVEMLGSFECDSSKCQTSSKMNNNIIDGLKNFDLNGEYDFSQADKFLLTFDGKTNDNQNTITFSSNLTPSFGFIDAKIVLPSLKLQNRQLLMNYEMEDDAGKLVMKNVPHLKEEDKIEINWHLAGSKQTVDVVTSFDSVRAVHVEKETITTSGGRISLNLHASVNEKEILALETAYQDFSELTFKLSTSCQLLNEVQVIYNLKSVSDFSLVASYNDVFDTRFIGKV